LGAEVIKVEPPGGERVRDRSEDGDTPEAQILNPNKRGIVLDLKSEAGRDALIDLVKESDVLIENFTAGKMSELGVGYETLQSVNPELIYGHGSGYGNDGPYTKYPAMDLTIQAMGGVMHTTGFPDNLPVKTGPAFSDFMGGIHLAAGILGALFKRERTGEGDFVEVGMFDCVFPALTSPIAANVKEIDAPPRTGNRHSGLAIAPYDVYAVQDDYLAIMCISETHWRSLARLMNREDLLDDPRLQSKESRAKHAGIVDEVIKTWLAGRDRDETVDLLLKHDIPTAPVQSVKEVMEDPHLEHRNMLNYVANQGEGKEEIPIPGMPIKFATSEDPEITPSPKVGEHTSEVLKTICNYSDTRIDEISVEDET